MKPNRFVWLRVVALTIFASLNFVCAFCFGQTDPLNSWALTWSGAANPIINEVTSIAYGNGMFVAVGDGARLVSYDGVSWTTYVSSPIINGYYTYGPNQSTYGPTPTPPGIAYGAGTFLTFGTSIADKVNYILKSTNGLTWTTIYTSSNGVSNAVFAAAYGDNAWVFISTNQIITASITSSNWNWTQFQPGFSPYSVAYGNGTFVIAPYGYPDFILSSSDGTAWQYDSTLPVSNPKLTFGNGVFVAAVVNYNASLTNPYIYEVFVSSNLLQWTSNIVCNTFGNIPNQVGFGGNQFIGSFGYYVWTSANAFGWTNRFSNNFSAQAYGAGTFVVGGADIYQSGIFSSQSNLLATTLGISTYPGVTINGTAGATYQIQYTTNLNSAWLPLTNFYLPYSPYLWIDVSSTVHGQRFYRSLQLQ
jgi:hypothetical protein